MGQAGACMYRGQWQLEKRVEIARRDSERGDGVLPDHYGGLAAGGVMPASLEWLFSWSWTHGRRAKRLELAYRQFSSLVSEIPSTFEYIDLEGRPGSPPNHENRGVSDGFGQ